MDLLGTLLMALSGLSTRTVRMADRLTLCPSKEYSIMLKREREGERERDTGEQEGSLRFSFHGLLDRFRPPSEVEANGTPVA